MIVLSLAIAPSAVMALWETNGVPVCTLPGSQQSPVIVPDGAGGAILAWGDYRGGSSTPDIYAQRLDASGTPRWAANGIPICVMTGYQSGPRIISDGAGGAIITWSDGRAGGGWEADIYAQRVSAAGVVGWTTNGICISPNNGGFNPEMISDGAGGAIITWMTLSSAAGIVAQRVSGSGVLQWHLGYAVPLSNYGDASEAAIVADGAGGAIVAWQDQRWGPDYPCDIYAQRVDATGNCLWEYDGTAICTAPFDQYAPQVAPDGAGGVIIAWEDCRSEAAPELSDIFAQRVSASGVAQWVPDGVLISTQRARGAELVTDGAGGAILANGGYDGFVQRIGPSGNLLWGAGGLPLPLVGEGITSDDAGGAVVILETGGYEYRLSAQRLDPLGDVQWAGDGASLSSGFWIGDARVVGDGTHGALAAWTVYRNGSYDVYAQSVDSQGRIGFLAPDITSVQDIPGDQGGWVRISIDRSALDVATFDPPVATYNVWQRVDNLRPAAGTGPAPGTEPASSGRPPDAVPPIRPAAAAGLSGWPITDQGGRLLLRSEDLATATFPSGTWELLGSFAAAQFEQYIYRASTLADSSAAGTPYSVYVVSAHTTIPSVWFASEPDSGYSVDNIPPGQPGGLAGQPSSQPDGLRLSWHANSENDLAYYAVYRGESEDFEPEPANRVATPVLPEWFDGAWHPDSGFYYKVSAIDVHDNQSGFALLGPEQLSDAGTSTAPKACYLAQNAPNPFGPETRISFGLTSSGQVSLSIYDAAGRLIRTLIDEERPAGRYDTLWDGGDANDRPVPGGIYYCRLRAGSFASTRRMVFTSR
jgi:hypothetical protein